MREKPLIILLAEDNPGDVDLIRESLLESAIPHRLHACPNGDAALDFLARRGGYAAAPRPDLVLLDLNLPKRNGREVLAVVKQDPELRRIPVVVLTSSQAETDIVKSYDLGANSYIAKPVELEQFQHIVRAIEAYWCQVVHLPP